MIVVESHLHQGKTAHREVGTEEVKGGRTLTDRRGLYPGPSSEVLYARQLSGSCSLSRNSRARSGRPMQAAEVRGELALAFLVLRSSTLRAFPCPSYLEEGP